MMLKHSPLVPVMVGVLLLVVGCGSSIQEPSANDPANVKQTTTHSKTDVTESVRSKGLHTSINDPGQRVSLEKHLAAEGMTVFEFYGDW